MGGALYKESRLERLMGFALFKTDLRILSEVVQWLKEKSGFLQVLVPCADHSCSKLNPQTVAAFGNRRKVTRRDKVVQQKDRQKDQWRKRSNNIKQWSEKVNASLPEFSLGRKIVLLLER